MKTRDIVTLTKFIKDGDERVFYYVVKANTISWHFYNLVEAERFVKRLGACYEYKEVVTDLI